MATFALPAAAPPAVERWPVSSPATAEVSRRRQRRILVRLSYGWQFAFSSEAITAAGKVTIPGAQQMNESRQPRDGDQRLRPPEAGEGIENGVDAANHRAGFGQKFQFRKNLSGRQIEACL